MIFGTISSGELAVDAFFIISGYLISQSWLIMPSSIRFLLRRIARILPGFIVCLLVGIIVYTIFFDPRYISNIWWGGFVKGLFVLKVKGLPPAFPLSHHAGLNGVLWTIHFEFFCYLGVWFFGLCGLLIRKFIMPIWVLLVVAYIGHLALIGNIQNNEYPVQWLRFSGCYLTGVVWYLYDSQIKFLAKKYIILIVPAFLFLLSHSALYVLAVDMLFPLLLSYMAYSIKTFNGFWLKHDISYGVYLYAWPIKKILIATILSVQNPLLLIGLTSLIAALFGWISWIAVERPAMQFIRHLERTFIQPLGKTGNVS